MKYFERRKSFTNSYSEYGYRDPLPQDDETFLTFSRRPVNLHFRKPTVGRNNLSIFTNSYRRRYNNYNFFRFNKIKRYSKFRPQQNYNRQFSSYNDSHYSHRDNLYKDIPEEVDEPKIASVCVQKTSEEEYNKINNSSSIHRILLFKHWALSELYDETNGRARSTGTGLDIESNDDAELSIWEKVNASYVLFLQKNYQNLKLAKAKYLKEYNCPYRASFQLKDFSLQNVQTRQTFSVICYHDSFHEGFYDDYSAAILADNIAKNLSKDGCLIVLITSASQVLKKVYEKGLTFGNGVYNIKFSKTHFDKPLKDFGVSFDFEIYGIEKKEYLVQISVLESILSERGMRIKCKKSMRQIYHEIKSKPEKIDVLQELGLLEAVSSTKQKLTLSDDEKELMDLYEGIVIERV